MEMAKISRLAHWETLNKNDFPPCFRESSGNVSQSRAFLAMDKEEMQSPNTAYLCTYFIRDRTIGDFQ